MSNVSNQFPQSRTKKHVFRTVNCAIGGTGAVGTKSEQATTITRTGAGAYRFLFDDSYVLFLSAHATVLAAGAFWSARIEAQGKTGGRNYVDVVTFVPGTNTAADPPSGSTLMLNAQYKDTLAT